MGQEVSPLLLSSGVLGGVWGWISVQFLFVRRLGCVISVGEKKNYLYFFFFTYARLLIGRTDDDELTIVDQFFFFFLVLETY